MRPKAEHAIRMLFPRATTVRRVPQVLGLSLLLAAFVPLASQAQQDTARHREVFTQVNAGLDSLKKVKATYKEDEFLQFDLTAWLDDKGAVRKINAVVPNEDGGGFEDFYYDGGKLLFVYRTFESGGGVKVEDRFYFREGAMFKWIDQVKKTVPASSDNFASEAERLTGNSAKFLAALQKTGAKPPAGKPTAAKAQVATGKFLRIDEGDYFHWVMQTSGGEELSLFILKPDASVEKVVEDPAKYVGRACRVTWKKSTETIPEAGGKMEIEQILSVEWVKK